MATFFFQLCSYLTESAAAVSAAIVSTTAVSVAIVSTIAESTAVESVLSEVLFELQAANVKDIAKAKKPNLKRFFIVNCVKSY